MINLRLKFKDEYKYVELNEDYLFNACLVEYPVLIKKIINAIAIKYKISKTYFYIVNSFIDFGCVEASLYPGLIVRVGINRYAVLYLEKSNINEDYMIKLIKEYIYDKGEHIPDDINIDKFEIDKASFLDAYKNI